jgi:DNA-binding response OmpR family regulator
MIKILVVEDDAKLNLAVVAYLNVSGFTASGCTSANDAYETMYNAQFDLIISDIMLPEVDEFEIQTVRGLGYKAVLL